MPNDDDLSSLSPSTTHHSYRCSDLKVERQCNLAKNVVVIIKSNKEVS